jgi:hypothetical protein
MDAFLVATVFALGVALSAAPGALNVGCALLLVVWGVQLVGVGAGRLVA